MIGFLKGKVAYKVVPFLFIDVNGVGYKVYASSPLLKNVQINSAVTVFTHTHVREDLLELYGFSAQEDLALFEKFLTISGIGPKTAINVFSLGEKDEIVNAIEKGDVDFFTGVPRLGRKNAQKIIIELKSKLGDLTDLDLGDEKDEVIDALLGFGFSRDEARKALRSINKENISTSEKIKLALKYLGK